MDVSEIDAIGRTAFEVAALRAAEHRRPDRLFADPCAQLFLDAAGIGPDASEDRRDFVAIMGPQTAVRTRFLDEALLAAAASGCEQVVLVASGMDSRPWRLDWPAGTEVYEIDQAPVLKVKYEVAAEHSLTARCEPRPVAADLRGDWGAELRGAGFRAGRKTAWLTEGLLYAWDEAGADRLLDIITGLGGPGSVLAFDHVEASAALTAAITRISPRLAELWQSGPADPADWLRRRGWEPDLRELHTVAAGYGRQVHAAYDGARGGQAHAWLGRASRP
jgi:methyltransferase (TIGR00027 family)